MNKVPYIDITDLTEQEYQMLLDGLTSLYLNCKPLKEGEKCKEISALYDKLIETKAMSEYMRGKRKWMI